MIRKILSPVILFFAVAVAITQAFGWTEIELRNEIRALVQQRHPSVPEGFWEKLGPEAIPVLKKLYGETTNGVERSFYIDGLSHFSDADVSAFLRREIEGTGNEVLKKKLLGAIIRSEGEASFDYVEPYLKDSDGHIRAEVAYSLKNYSANSQKVAKRLEQFKNEEKTSWVVAEYNRPAQKIERTFGKPAILMPSPTPAPTPIAEKNLGGKWRGAFVTEKKMMAAEVDLISLGGTPLQWRAEFRIPKLVKQEWKKGDFTVHYFQTARGHWLELRNSKLDIVFLAQKKAQ